jgi:hypothetical protein
MIVLREALTAREAKREIEALRRAGEKIRQTPETAKAFCSSTASSPTRASSPSTTGDELPWVRPRLSRL